MSMTLYLTLNLKTLKPLIINPSLSFHPWIFLIIYLLPSLLIWRNLMLPDWWALSYSHNTDFSKMNFSHSTTFFPPVHPPAHTLVLQLAHPRHIRAKLVPSASEAPRTPPRAITRPKASIWLAPPPPLYIIPSKFSRVEDVDGVDQWFLPLNRWPAH